jgi:hypothetical protein
MSVPDSLPLLRGFKRLSSQSRDRRFLVPTTGLTDEMVS